MIKKIITLIWIMFCTLHVYGQQEVDFILKARALTVSGKPDQAISLLGGAIADFKESRFYIERADAYILKGDYSSAIGDYNEANKISPFSGEYGLSRIYALKSDAATALYHLELNLKSPFRKGEKVIMLDPAFATVDNTPEWRQFWKKEWYSNTEKGVSEIEYYISTGKIDEAKSVLLELKRSYNGDNNDITYAEALISLASGNNNEAIKLISGLITLNPEDERYLWILAKAQVASSNHVGASNSYTKLLGLGIADAKLLILRADCFRQIGEAGKAQTDIEKFLSLYPDDKEALSLAGKIEVLSGDNLKALEYYSKNLKLHPNDPECYIDRANSYFISKSWQWAINDYSMSLDLEPGNPDIWLNKGIALLNSGRLEDACHDFRKSFDLGSRQASGYISRNCIK